MAEVNDDDRWRGIPEQDPGADATLLWSAPFPAGSSLDLSPNGGCIVTTATSVTGFGRDGTVLWNAPMPGEVYRSTPIAISDGEFVRLEGDAIVTRALNTGLVLNSFSTPHAVKLSLAPWGDLIYSGSAGNTATVNCVDRLGNSRWSVAIDDIPPPHDAPFSVGEVVVIARRGLLWAYDQSGQSQWVVDQDGVRQPRPADEQRRTTGRLDPDRGTRIFAGPVQLDPGRVIVALQSYSSVGLYLLDGDAALITTLERGRTVRPFTVLPHPAEFQIVRFAGKITVGDMDWRYLITSFEPNGGTTLWEHRLPAEPIQLSTAPDGTLFATGTASTKRWRDYGPHYTVTLIRETYIRCINPDGTARWTWHANGPITHPPVIDSDGTIYVGAEQKLWAFASND